MKPRSTGNKLLFLSDLMQCEKSSGNLSDNKISAQLSISSLPSYVLSIGFSKEEVLKWSGISEDTIVIDKVESLEAAVKKHKETGYDIFILRAFACKNLISFLYEVKTWDITPSVVVVYKEFSSWEISFLYRAGCAQCIYEACGWEEEVKQSILRLRRLRQIEKENERLKVGLTEANNKLKEKNRKLNEFTAVVAHDLRGPLAGINMKLEYIIDEINNLAKVEIKKLLESALFSTERVLEVLRCLYQITKESISIKDRREVNLEEVIEEAASIFQDREIKPLKIIMSDLPSVYGNKGLLYQLFFNLIDNALKYNDKQEVVVTINYEGEVILSNKKFVRLSVVDNGEGIPKERLQSVFNMFSRGEVKRGPEGLGIGLSVVKKIIELHGGTISLNSQVGVGTRFTFTLPLEQC